MISPSDLKIWTYNGVDDIALTIYPGHEPGVYALSSLRIYYSAGSSSATVSLSVDHRQGGVFDFWLFDIASAGGGGSNVHLGISEDEAKEWYFVVNGAGDHERDGLKIAQTLGASDEWAIEAAFIRA